MPAGNLITDSFEDTASDGAGASAGRTPHRSWLRLGLSTALAIIVTVFPSLAFYYFRGIGLNDIEGAEVLLLYLPLLVGSFVFASLERPRPEWLHGVLFGLGVSIVATAVLLALWTTSNATGGRDVLALTMYALVFVILGSSISMAGSGLASVAAGPLGPDKPNRLRRSLRPWHLGLAVAALEIVLVGLGVGVT